MFFHAFSRFVLLKQARIIQLVRNNHIEYILFSFAFSHHFIGSHKRQNKLCPCVCALFAILHWMQFINVYNFICHKYCILRWQANILYALGNSIIYRFLNKYYANCFVDRHPPHQLNSIPTWNNLRMHDFIPFYQLRNKTIHSKFRVLNQTAITLIIFFFSVWCVQFSVSRGIFEFVLPFHYALSTMTRRQW